MGRIAPLFLALCLLTGCAAPAEEGPKRYEATFLELFDTVTTIVGYADSEEEFTAQVQEIHDQLEVYHQLYDIYNDYEGVTNLKTVNDRAGEAVEVDEKIIDLLLLARELYDATGGKVDAAMGSVLSLWHEARENGINDPESAALPEEAAIERAMDHMDFSQVEIDQAASTVRLADPEMSLDVGAIAKGYATEQVAAGVPEGYLISVGGNVRATGPKADGSPWVVGVENPDGGDYLHTLNITGGAVVTSGDYQRYYTVDGVRYHHIIDPDTGWPAGYFRAVTVLCSDSGIADGLSTALFTMTEEEGRTLLETFDAQALWVYPDGTVVCTDGFSAQIRT